MATTTSRVGKRGAIVIPADLRNQYGLEEGTLVITEAHENGILLRPAVACPVEIYSPQRRAEFLLSNAVDDEDYRRAILEVKEMGIDPDTIPHRGPGD